MTAEARLSGLRFSLMLAPMGTPRILLLVAALAAWSTLAQAGVLTSAAEDGFQDVIARYRAEGLGSAGSTLEGIDIEKTSVRVKLRVNGAPLTLLLREPEDPQHPGPVRWFLVEVVEGDASTPAAVEARRRLTSWLQTAFVTDPWTPRSPAGPAATGPTTVASAPMMEQLPRQLPPFVVWSLAVVTVLLGGGLLWRP